MASIVQNAAPCNLKDYILPTLCIRMFQMILTLNSHCFTKQFQPNAPCNADVVFSVIWE